MIPLNEQRKDNHLHLALVHHANQYVITDGYLDRQGMGDILGLGSQGPFQRGLLPLLQMHLDYRVPLNLHLSGTLMETLAWHYPESFSLIKRLRRAGLLELVGSAFSQNIMPFFSEQYNLRQINEELWLYRRHLGCDLSAVKTFWVPERVWDTEKLAGVLRSDRLLNKGYDFVLLDDRLVYPAGDNYWGSARERFDCERPLEVDAFMPWEIVGGRGLVMLPISKDLRYLIPPIGPESFHRLTEIFNWLASTGDERVLAVYGDDLEKAAGVGGWDCLHLERYERFLRWLLDNRWIKPVLISRWAQNHAVAGRREIERGTFYELARMWKAGEDYRGWYEDPNCFEHRQYLIKAEQTLIEAERSGADAGLLEFGWKHLLHCSYETSWHHFQVDRLDDPMYLAPWAAALTSHARSCFIIAMAARWFNRRDGAAHAEMIDIDGDGDEELVLKNDHLFAVLSPRWGGRLTYLFDLTGRSGRLVIGNLSDDWNLQEELNRYMDCPRNHPGALAEVGHEHDQYQVTIFNGEGQEACLSLRNVQPGSSLYGGEKQIRLSADAGHITVSYIVPQGLWQLSTEVCLSPNYYNLLRHGRASIAAFNGPDWRGWSNAGARAWARIDLRQSTIWDKPHQSECGHGLNLRITSFSKNFNIELGVGAPPGRTDKAKTNGKRRNGNCHALSSNFNTQGELLTGAALSDQMGFNMTQSKADGDGNNHNGDGRRNGNGALSIMPLPVADSHFMRQFLNHNLPAMKMQRLQVQACRVRVLKPHHNRLTLEYNLLLKPDKNRSGFASTLVGIWRQDGRAQQIYQLLEALWQAGFGDSETLAIPQPLGYWKRLNLMLSDKAPGLPLKQWIYNPDADWPGLLRRVAAWLAKLHNSRVKVAQQFTIEKEIDTLNGWMADLIASDQPWLSVEKQRIELLLREIITCQRIIRSGDLCLTHGDFHPENIFIRGCRVTVIDFEHSSMGDPAIDLGYLIGQIDLQSDRHWLRRSKSNPFDIERLAELLLEEYHCLRPAADLGRVPLYRARTYMKHLMYTVRMKGTEDSTNITLWLDKAAACLKAFHSLPQSYYPDHKAASIGSD